MRFYKYVQKATECCESREGQLLAITIRGNTLGFTKRDSFAPGITESKSIQQSELRI